MWNKKRILALVLLGCLWIGELVAFVHALGPRDNRFLICMTSYKRPTFLSGQVLRMMHQTYPNFDVSLSIKGVPSTFVRRNLEEEWREYINAGRLRLRLDKNRDQFSNFLDTVRYVDLSHYDWFCRVDDDDWYAPDYLKHINEALKQSPQVVMSETQRALVMEENVRTITYYYNEDDKQPQTAASMCFSRAVIAKALELEKNSQAFQYFFERRGIKNATELRSMSEDILMRQIALSMGKIQVRYTPQTDIIFGRQYPSLTRNDDFAYLPEPDETTEKE